MYLLAGCLGGHVVGIVHYLFHCSCWTLGNYCYLQDLFVDAQARGLGVGATLIKTVESAARAAGASRLYWLTKEDNRTARALYDKLAERSASFSTASSSKAMHGFFDSSLTQADAGRDLMVSLRQNVLFLRNNSLFC
jgi:GNAT superfamily N-acetyltransferase